MVRVTLFQKMKPFISFCLVILPFTLFFLVISSGSILKNVPPIVDPASPKGAQNNLRLAASTKYAAGNVEGVDNNDNAKVVSGKLFGSMVETARLHPRKRKMTDLTKEPTHNSMQTLMNTWIDGSYSPVHCHDQYSETFVILDGALAFFTFSHDGSELKCHVLNALSPSGERLIIVEKNQYHAMTAAPASMGWPGHAIVFETSGHKYDTSVPTKTLATFAPIYGDGMDGDPEYFQSILKLCPSYSS